MGKIKKILIPYVYAGANHYEIALLTKNKFDQLYKRKVRVDLMRMEEELNDTGLKLFYFKNWEMIMKMGKVSYFGYWVGLKLPFLGFGLQHIFVRNAIPKTLGYLKCYKPDLIFSTHFGCAYILNRVRKKYKYNFPLVFINTDWAFSYPLHNVDADYIICQGDEAKKWMLRVGIPEEKMVMIDPVYHPKFDKKLPPKKQLRKKLGWKDKFTVLLASGGQGVAPFEKFIKEFKETKINAQLVVVTGWNRKAEEKLKRMNVSDVIVYGFVDNMHELMEASDIVSGKAGALYVLETVVKKRPLLITQLASANELPYADFIKNNKLGWVALGPKKFAKQVKTIYENKNLLKEAQENLKKLKIKNGTEKLVKFLYSLL